MSIIGLSLPVQPACLPASLPVHQLVYPPPCLPVFNLPACPQTLERSYLLRVNGKVVERPQHMLMRVAVGIHMEDVDAGG